MQYWKPILMSFLTHILLTWGIWWVPNNASKWQMGFNLSFKGLIPLKYKEQFDFERKESSKNTAQVTEIFRHSLSPYCISTTSFRWYNWQSNSDSRPLLHWLEHGGLCISGDVFSYFKVPKRSWMWIRNKRNMNIHDKSQCD